MVRTTRRMRHARTTTGETQAMSGAIVQLNKAALKGEMKNSVKSGAEETLNAPLDHETKPGRGSEHLNSCGGRRDDSGYREIPGAAKGTG